MGDQLWLYGTKGSLNLTLQDATFFYEPKKVAKVVTAPNGKDEAVVTTASYNPANDALSWARQAGGCFDGGENAGKGCDGDPADKFDECRELFADNLAEG